MSYQERISSIKLRMYEIQSRFGNEHVNVISSKGTPAPSTLSSAPQTSFQSELMKNLGQLTPSEKDSSETPEISAVIKEASEKYGVEEALIRAVIKQESGFNPQAVSWCGAQGMMQLMPDTAKDLGVNDPMNPRDNIMGGVKYLKEQLDRFGGDPRKALAAYNAGPGAVIKYNGIPPYNETQNYVKNIMAMYEDYKIKG